VDASTDGTAGGTGMGGIAGGIGSDAAASDANVVDASGSDAGGADAGVAEGGLDTGAADSGSPDSSVSDAGGADSGAADASGGDAGLTDASAADATEAGPAVECFELRAHNAQTPGDTTPFQVGLGPWATSPGQFLENFIFRTPYSNRVTAVRLEPLIDNASVVYAWTLHHVARNHASYRDGTHAVSLGSHTDSFVVIGWARGGDAIEMPPGVGMEMPEPGGLFELEIHYDNPGGALTPDRSGVRLCVTSQPVQDIATTTMLGTEQINVPARSRATATGTCRPDNPQGGNINILKSIPHMRGIGTNMRTVINTSSGPTVLLDQPFNPLQQRSYDTPAVVKPGETLTTTCSYNNTSGASVGFGTVVQTEVCFNLVIAFPARALANPGNSILGNFSTCLQ
jgi:hypothetical protein